LAQGLHENNPGKYLNFALSILHVSVTIKRNCADIGSKNLDHVQNGAFHISIKSTSLLVGRYNHWWNNSSLSF